MVCRRDLWSATERYFSLAAMTSFARYPGGISQRAEPAITSGRTEGHAFSSYLHFTRLSCEAMICHIPSRFSHVSVQTWHTSKFGLDLSLPKACSLP